MKMALLAESASERMLYSLFAADEGEVTVAGCSLARQPTQALAHLGVVFQQPSLDLDLSVRRNLSFHARLHGLVAADAVLIPLHCEYFALEGIAELMATMERVRASLNPELSLEGVLLTMYDERTNLGQQVSANIREYFGGKVYTTVIPRNVRLGEAPSHGVPVILHDARSRGAEAYIALAKEFLARRHAVVA